MPARPAVDGDNERADWPFTWTGVLMIGLEAFIQSSATKLAPAIAKVLLGYETKTNRQLTRIEKSVDALLLAPYHEASRYLETASLPGLDMRERDKDTKWAVRRLRTAESQLVGTAHWRIAHDAQLSLSIVYGSRGSGTKADHWARLAHTTAITGTELVVAEVNSRMELAIGRLRIFGRVIPLLAFSVLVLWTILKAAGATQVLSHVPITFATFAMGFLMYLEAKYHYRTVMGWWFGRRLRSQSEFLEEQTNACNALLLPGAPSLDRASIEAIADSEGPSAFRVHRVVDSPTAYSNLVEAVAAYMSAAEACVEEGHKVLPLISVGVAPTTLGRKETAMIEEWARLHRTACARLSAVRNAYASIERKGNPRLTATAASALALLGEPAEADVEGQTDIADLPPVAREGVVEVDTSRLGLQQQDRCEDATEVKALVMAILMMLVVESRQTPRSDV